MLIDSYRWVTPRAKASKGQIIKNKIISKTTSAFYMLMRNHKPIYISSTKKCNAIVSLTSFPARINGLYYCLCSIFNQSLSPKRVVLWLATEQFPEKEKNLPGKIVALKTHGLEIKFCDDIRSYKKIFYMAQEAFEDNIIIIDDDTLYPEDWLEKMWQEHELYPDNVICYRAHKILIDGDRVKPYDKWEKLAPNEKGPSLSLIPIGVGGVLYPSDCFRGVKWDKIIIKEMAPTTDDIWLKCLMISRGIKVVKVNVDSIEWFTVLGTQKERLVQENVENDNKNDKALNKCMKYFGLIACDFVDKKEE